MHWRQTNEYFYRIQATRSADEAIEVLTGFIRDSGRDVTKHDINQRYSKRTGSGVTTALRELTARGFVHRNEFRIKGTPVVYSVVSVDQAIDDRTRLSNELFQIIEYHESQSRKSQTKGA